MEALGVLGNDVINGGNGDEGLAGGDFGGEFGNPGSRLPDGNDTISGGNGNDFAAGCQRGPPAQRALAYVSSSCTYGSAAGSLSTITYRSVHSTAVSSSGVSWPGLTRKRSSCCRTVS
jgi:hypothetical protein